MFDTARADLDIGESRVRQRDGIYTLHAKASGSAGTAEIDLTLRPVPDRYFPPVELREQALLSGYVVPALAASASGTICVAARCSRPADAPAYHDHNWGVWRDVTWEWGSARGSRVNVLYGGVYEGDDSGSPFFLSLVDSLGVRQILRFHRIEYEGAQPAAGARDASAPKSFSLVASRIADTVRLDVIVADVLASGMGVGGMRRAFLQMRGDFRLRGRVGGEAVADSGTGFFETYVKR